jgi:hypothetical protein
MLLVDIIGYIALGIAMISFMQGSIMKLRVLGVVASTLFFAQAMMLESNSLMVANVCFALIHLYWIFKYKRVRMSDDKR